jgi:hypothetical protein
MSCELRRIEQVHGAFNVELTSSFKAIGKSRAKKTRAENLLGIRDYIRRGKR